MSTRAQRRGFAGVNSLRRKLRRLDADITRDLKAEMESGARAIERDMIGGAPVDEGDLARSISYKMGKDGLTAVIGPGADNAHVSKAGFADVKTGISDSGKLVGITKTGADTKATVDAKHAREQLFKALWIEFGTKTGAAGSHSTPARPFIQPAYDVNKDKLVRNIRSAVSSALEAATDV